MTQIDNDSFMRYKKMNTGQLRNAAMKLHAAATGDDPENINWDSYDRGGLIEVVRHRHEQLAAKGATLTVVEVNPDDGDVILEDEGVTIVQPPLKKRPVNRPVPIETKTAGDGTTIDERWATDEGPAEATPADKVRDALGGVVAKAKTPRVKKEKVVVEKGPRKRRISNEVIQAIRLRRLTLSPVPSYAKLAAWLKEEHDLTVTGDLVRSIIVREIYGDVPDLPLPDESPVVTTADLDAAYVSEPAVDDQVDEAATEALALENGDELLSDAHDLESDF
jgi:hypothetical protein